MQELISNKSAYHKASCAKSSDSNRIVLDGLGNYYGGCGLKSAELASLDGLCQTIWLLELQIARSESKFAIHMYSISCLSVSQRQKARPGTHVRAIHSSKNCESKKRSRRSVFPASGGFPVFFVGEALPLLASPSFAIFAPPLSRCILSN